MSKTTPLTEDFNDLVQKTVSSAWDWATIRKYDGRNLTPQQWLDFARHLDVAMQKAAPQVKPDVQTLSHLEDLCNLMRNVTMLEVVATQIVSAHLMKGDGRDAAVTHVRNAIERRVRGHEKHYGGDVPAFDPLHHVANMFDADDRGLRTMDKIEAGHVARKKNTVIGFKF